MRPNTFQQLNDNVMALTKIKDELQRHNAVRNALRKEKKPEAEECVSLKMVAERNCRDKHIRVRK